MSAPNPPFLPLIGLIGKKRSGKDTVAEFLQRDPYAFERLAFADALKDTALALDPLVKIEHDERGPLMREADYYFAPLQTYRLSFIVAQVGWEAAKSVREVRRTLQDLGLGVRLHVDLDAWLRPVIAKAKARTSPIVVTDVRFPNEADAIEAAGGFLVRVIRPSRPIDGAGEDHVSETALDDRVTRFTVANTGTLRDLEERVDDLYDDLWDLWLDS